MRVLLILLLGASGAGKLNPKTVPNSFPPKYQKNTTKITHTKRLVKNSFGFGKKHSSIISSPKYLPKVEDI